MEKFVVAWASAGGALELFSVDAEDGREALRLAITSLHDLFHDRDEKLFFYDYENNPPLDHWHGPGGINDPVWYEEEDKDNPKASSVHFDHWHGPQKWQVFEGHKGQLITDGPKVFEARHDTIVIRPLAVMLEEVWFYR